MNIPFSSCINSYDKEKASKKACDYYNDYLKFSEEKLKKKVDDIKLRKTDNLIDPYDTLKPLIDSINTKITKSSELSTDDKKRELLNKISDINIALDSDPKDYTKIIEDAIAKGEKLLAEAN
jgi:hypothetical protein